MSVFTFNSHALRTYHCPTAKKIKDNAQPVT